MLLLNLPTNNEYELGIGRKIGESKVKDFLFYYKKEKKNKKIEIIDILPYPSLVFHQDTDSNIILKSQVYFMIDGPNPREIKTLNLHVDCLKTEIDLNLNPNA